MSSFTVRAVLQLVVFTLRALLQLALPRPSCSLVVVELNLRPPAPLSPIKRRWLRYSNRYFSMSHCLPSGRRWRLHPLLCCSDAAPRSRLSVVATQLNTRCLPRVSNASEHVLETQHEQHVVQLRTSLVSTDIRKSAPRLSMVPQKPTNCFLGNLQFACCPPLLCHHHPKPRPGAAATRSWPCCAASCCTCNSFLIHSSLLFQQHLLQLHNLLHKHMHVFSSR